MTLATFDAWHDRAPSLAAFEVFDGTNLALTGTGLAERLRVTDATPGLLTLLGVSPAIGRTFATDDVGRRVAIVSHAFWRGTLGADSNVIGREIVVGDRSHTVVGVLPERFDFALGDADIWRPLDVAAGPRESERVLVLARLNAASTPAQVTAALSEVSRTSAPPARVVPMPIATAIAGDRATTLTLLAGAAGLATVIAFANLAGLLLVRSTARRRELAVRTALRARPRKIVRQLLVESIAVVALSTCGSICLAWWLTPAVAALTLEHVGGFETVDVALSWWAVGTVALLAAVCACLCGSVPAMTATRWSRECASRHELPLRDDGGRRLVSVGLADPAEEAVVRSASLGYLDVMRIPVVAGRSFEHADNAAITVPRVVISQVLADRLFGAAPPVGRQVWLLQRAVAAEVIGVVGDVKHRALDEGPLPRSTSRRCRRRRTPPRSWCEVVVPTPTSSRSCATRWHRSTRKSP